MLMKNYNISNYLLMGNHLPRRLTAEEQLRLEEGKPVVFEGGVRIKKNPLTG